MRNIKKIFKIIAIQYLMQESSNAKKEGNSKLH